MTDKNPDVITEIVHLTEEIGQIAQIGMQMQSAGIDMLFAEMRALTHTTAAGSVSSAAGSTDDDLFDNMPV